MFLSTQPKQLPMFSTPHVHDEHGEGDNGGGFRTAAQRKRSVVVAALRERLPLAVVGGNGGARSNS